MDALVEACMENELFRRDVLQALVALIPEVRQRADLGLDADTREDALMDAIVQLLAAEVGEHGAVEAISTTDPVSRMARSYAARILSRRTARGSARVRTAGRPRATDHGSPAPPGTVDRTPPA